ncbi:hypothetical protein N7523_010897 [Penicillium sp. IBT 18751x]|nr:hypothetical protein N7523_010897 [Penicillium sp. IBT 18751x]
MVEILPDPARPPTPPRPGSRLEDRKSPVAQTPGQSSQPDTRAPPSSRGSKRVTFSPWPHTTATIQSPRFPKKSKSKDSPNFKSPLSVDNRPFKSILKETSSPIPVWSPNVDTFTTESLAMLLESVIQQLAGESIPSRLDAYMQFFGALRTYDGLPAGKDIAEKLGLITDFIQRDVTRNLVDPAPLDTNLAIQALKLCNAFVWHKEISAQLSEDFRVFLVEHAITGLQEGKAPKSVLTHYMSILATQNFGSKVMSSNRVTRILTVLQDENQRISGKAIALHRLSIYQRLLTQSKGTFISHSTLWVEQLVHGLLNQVKETRAKAVALGFQISMAAGPSPGVSKSIRDLFDRPIGSDRKMAAEVHERMSRMMGSLDSGAHVPQVWSVIVLLLRSKKWRLDQWEHFKEWVLVLQKCFNCSEPVIKAHAIVSWNRFVYAVSPDETTGLALLKMLGRPVLSQFEKKKSDKSASPPTQLALASYYNLLYYTFRPSSSYRYLDMIWEEYVAMPSTSTFSTLPALSDSASRVLGNILWTQQAKVWSENRINDNSKIEVEEIPSVDPKWIRSRVSVVLRVFESLFKSSVWDDDALERSHIASAWNCLGSALSLASSKEITPSGESMQAVASALGLLYRLWIAGPSSLNALGDNSTDLFYERFRFLSKTIILSLGGIPFTEKLFLKTLDGTSENGSTPAHHLSGAGTNLENPIVHLLRIIMTTNSQPNPTISYSRLVDETIGASCNARISRGSRLELLQQCANISTEKSPHSSQISLFQEEVWKSSARAAADALRSFPVESARERDGSVSRDYDNVIKILFSGLQFTDCSQEWSNLLGAFMRVVEAEKGDQVTLIVAPVAEGLLFAPTESSYRYLTALLNHASSISFTRETGLGIANTIAQQESSSSIPAQLVEAIASTLQLTYRLIGSPKTDGLDEFLKSFSVVLGSGTKHFRSNLLLVLQPTLAAWMKDEEQKFDGVDSRIKNAYRTLSGAIITVLDTCVDDTGDYTNFGCLIREGLESTQMSRALDFLGFWEQSETARKAFSDSTAMEDSARQSKARLIASNFIPEEQFDIEKVSFTRLILVGPSIDSWESQTLNPDSPSYKPTSPDLPQLRVNSSHGSIASPTLERKPANAVESAESAEPQLPDVHPELKDDQLTDDILRAHFPANRRDFFKELANIGSSSPVNTSGKPGYDTPVYLRRLQSSHKSREIPLTPTLAPAENDECFVGSSPTPATRDPTPAMNSDIPLLKHQDVMMTNASDPPSSPPGLDSRSPSPNKSLKRKKNERRRSAKAKEAMLRRAAEQHTDMSNTASLNSHNKHSAVSAKDNVPEDPKENKAGDQSDERPPSRRTRSALGHGAFNDQNPTCIAPIDTPAKDTESSPMQNSKSKSASKKKRRKRNSSKLSSEESQQLGQVDINDPPISTPEPLLEPAPAPDYSIDSSSEDVETQIASQLEQDLELAVDLRENIDEVQREEQPRSPVSTKKRKRDDNESRTPTAKERRRSTRLSSTKEIDSGDLNEVDSSSVKFSSPTLRRSTRGSQRNEETTNEISESIQEHNEDEVTPRPPSKRSRKLARVEGQFIQASTEESSSQAGSTPGTRSRKTRSSRRQSKLLEDQHDDQDMVPDSLPLVSTEEATDSQMTDMGSSIDVQTNDETDISHHPKPSVVIEEVVNIDNAEYHTTPQLPHSNTTGEGISESLKKLLSDMKSAALGPNALREVDDLLFNIRIEAHEASRRYNA